MHFSDHVSSEIFRKCPLFCNPKRMNNTSAVFNCKCGSVIVFISSNFIFIFILYLIFDLKIQIFHWLVYISCFLTGRATTFVTHKISTILGTCEYHVFVAYHFLNYIRNFQEYFTIKIADNLNINLFTTVTQSLKVVK